MADVGCDARVPGEKTRLARGRVAGPDDRGTHSGPVAVDRGVDHRADGLRGVFEVLQNHRRIFAMGPGADHRTVGPDAVTRVAVAVEHRVTEMRHIDRHASHVASTP